VGDDVLVSWTGGGEGVQVVHLTHVPPHFNTNIWKLCCGSGSGSVIIVGTDPNLNPDPSITKQKSTKNLNVYLQF
jgi:hypothetical protein